jgi:hypothetical protein
LAAHRTRAPNVTGKRLPARQIGTYVLVALDAQNAGFGRAYAAWRRVVMSDACLTGMAFGLWRTTLSSGLTEQGSYGGGAAGSEALVSN